MRWFLMLCGLAGTTYLLLDGRESAHGTASFEVGRPFAATARTPIADLRRGLQGPVLRVAGLPAQTPVRGTPSFAASSEDPWIDGPPPSSAPTREAHAHAPAVSGAEPVPRWKVWRPRGDGGRDGAWTTWRGPRPPADAAIPRVHYDLAAMVPTYGGWLPALAKRTQEFLGRPFEDGWWASLVLSFQRLVAEAARDCKGCFVARDSERPVLIVRAPEHVHDALRDLLDAEDRALRSVRRVALERPASETLYLDLPMWRVARAMRGDAQAYLMDYDIEISQDSFVSDPILGIVEGGLGIAAWRWVEGGSERFEVTVSRSTGPVRWTREVWESGAWGAFEIEVPEATSDDWSLTLEDPTQGAYAVVLGGKVCGRVVLGATMVLAPDMPRRWRAHREPVPCAPPRAGPLRVQVQGSRSGLLGTQIIGRSARGGPARVLLNRPVGRGDTAVEGRAVLHVAWRGTLRAGTALALTLSVGHRRAEARSVAASRPALDGEGRVAMELMLPSADMCVDGRHVMLDPDRASATRFDADLGLGLETLHITLAPHEGLELIGSGR